MNQPISDPTTVGRFQIPFVETEGAFVTPLSSTSSVNETILPNKTCYLGCSNKEGWGPISAKYADFTPCFLQGFAGSIAAFIVIGAALTQTRILLKNRKSLVPNKIDWSFHTKLGLVLFQLFLYVLLVFLTTSNDSIRFALVLELIAGFSILTVHYVQQFTSTVSSGVVLFYWLWQIILRLGNVLGFTLRGKIHTHVAILSILTLVNASVILLAELYFPMVPPIGQTRKKRSPFDTANIFARLTFTWMDGLMKKGYSMYLTQDDLPPLPNEIKSSVTATAFREKWNSKKRGAPTLFYAITRAFGSRVLEGSAFKVVMDVLGFVQPQLLRLLIKFVNEYSETLKNPDLPPVSLNKGFMISVAMFAVSASQTVCAHQYYHRSFDLGMKIRTSLTAVIYAKALNLSGEARQNSSTGDIVNLMAVDVQRLQDLVQNIQIAWSGPFQIALCLISLYNLLGSLVWVALLVMIVLIPINSQIARRQKQMQTKQMKIKDERSSLVSEILNNMKSLKFYNWEAPYLSKLNYVRNEKELKNLKTIGVLSAVSVFAATLSPFLVSCSTFGIFILFEGNKRTLLTDIVFPALSLFNLLNLPLSVLPLVVSNIAESQVAIKRITEFLNAKELQQDSVIKHPRAAKIGDVAVLISNGTFLWSERKQNSGSSNVALKNINFESKKGSLDCIVGRVGSGKSAVIQAILGDLHKDSGTVNVHGKVAYVSQVPWIMNGTVRENILFGHKYDPKYYQEVLAACALNSDLLMLTDGDKTEVGEKGISLSGGQKARVALARAVYSGSDVYVLDDTLSAVDEHVGKHITDHVLGPHGLLKTKCRILATNNIKILGISNSINLVSNGSIIQQGKFSDISLRKDTPLSQLISEFGQNNSEDTEGVSTSTSTSSFSSIEIPVGFRSRRGSEVSLIRDEDEDEDDGDSDQVDVEESGESHRRREHVEQGKVKWDVYLAYIKACNPKSALLFILATMLSILVSVLSNVWLKHWSEVNTEYGFNPNVIWYLGIYVALGVSSSLLSLAQMCILWIYSTIQGSKVLHRDMAISVMRAPMSFFETTPIGRILNRFSNDVYKIDEQMGRVFGLFFTNLLKVFFTVIVICVSTWPFIFLVVPLVLLYTHYQQYYLRTSRELRRLDSVSRSPIFSNFQESLNGVSIIRAYNQQERFKQINQSLIDKNMRAFNPAINANRWLAVRLEFIGSIIIFAASALSILLLRSGGLTAGIVGLSVSYALQITNSLGTIVRMTVEVETNIVSVERILEYSSLTPEAPEIIPSNRPPITWPESGKIIFKDYSTKYRPDLELVLKNINLSINSNEKIGIVGRTGAGKSSLTIALFRIIEAFGGEIDIDLVNVNKIGLSDLRRHLSIIPQDSQVFQGTVRSNLDPTDAYTDEKIWKALELSHLKDHVLKMFEDISDNNESSKIDSALEVPLSEGGSNLSVGQRQLMCLARALLIQSPILVLDEATAAVDVETDSVLQTTIRREFLNRTIITIAHRLNTILDSDRIVVLDKGTVAEYDTPENLLKNEGSLFYSLCKQGGFLNGK